MMPDIATRSTRAERDVIRNFFRAARPPRVRGMLEFAREEIVLPDGPDKGERFDPDRQPFARRYFELVDSGQWSIHAVTGPSQTGKTLIGYVIPGMFHLFEHGETVVLGLPSMDMSRDKWREDVLPAIEASRYRELLPRTGAGSRGGSIEAIKFRNGATLKFMSAGGGDKKRAGFTSRVLLLTEVDGFDKASGTSREAGPVEQMLARTEAFADNSVVYMECTVSIDEGRIWQEFKGGTASRLALPCPHCKHYVTPEREHLVGWQGADDELQAREAAHLACPECAKPWTEQQRIDANHRAMVVHRGQEIAGKGARAKVTGPLPRTRTLGYRWTAANNLLAPIGRVGEKEWRAAHAVDQDAAEKQMRQFVWTVPVEPDDKEVVSLGMQAITTRQSPTPMGLVPGWADVLTLGVDCGQWLLHWTLMAGDSQRRRHVQVVDYGVEEVHSRQFPVDEALSLALQSLSSRVEDPDRGWPDEQGEVRHPDLIWYDAGWKPVPVYKHCRASGPKHWPAKGLGLGQYTGVRYRQPKTTGATVQQIYDGFHLARIKHTEMGNVQIYEHDADKAKARVHDRLGTPIDEAGAILMPQVERAVEHTTFAKHLLAEQLVEEEGMQKWRKTPGHGGHNHWLDATALALLALIRRWSGPQHKAPAGGWYANQKSRRRS